MKTATRFLRRIGRINMTYASDMYTATRKEYITEWRVWYRMLQCCDPERQEKAYVEVEICEDWKGPNGFLTWFDDMGPRPKHCNTLERINKFGDFEPGNVRWSTIKVRNGNQRQHQVKTNKVKQAIANGIKRTTYYQRVRMGWNPEDASTIPAEPGGRLLKQLT
jgi:hypothetical protein